MRSKTICIKLPIELLERVDAAALASYASRSTYIRETLLLRLKGQKAINRDMDDFLERLKKLRRTD